MDYKSPSLGALGCFSLLPFHPQVHQVPQVPATIFCPTFPGCLATCHSPGRSVSLGQVPFVPPTVVEFVLVFPCCETNRLQRAASPLLPSAPGFSPLLQVPPLCSPLLQLPRGPPPTAGFLPPIPAPWAPPGPASFLRCGVCSLSLPPSLGSHRGDSHDEFSAAALRAPRFMRSQVTQDVQNGVSTVVLGHRV